MQDGVIIPGEPRGLQRNETILAQCLKNDGYATYAIGKWHLGDCLTDLLPSKRGFDYHLGYWEGIGDYYKHGIGEPKGYDFHKNTKPDLSANGTYSTDLYTRKAVELIMSHDTRRPMFMYVAQQNVHSPVQAPDDAVNQFPYVANRKRRTFNGSLPILSFRSCLTAVLTIRYYVNFRHAFENGSVFWVYNRGASEEEDVERYHSDGCN